MVDAVKISKKVLARLSYMDYEKDGGSSSEQLIFPNKKDAKGDVRRISEQELRLLFIEEFKVECSELFYSIETPTEEKYKFGKTYNALVNNLNIHKRSASLDMCVFERNSNKYKRILNIEFKHSNTDLKNIAKDVLKLLREKQNGVFIFLLDNTTSGTLRNKSKNRNGVFDKLYKSFPAFRTNWTNKNKCIQLIILSLKQKTLIHRKICKKDLNDLNNLNNLKKIFFQNTNCGDITTINNKNGWKVI